ncbi:MAG TPA: hypothetical protein VM260_05250, partial [Pirellula sp.]|nr:hypothetical protein [Pirellula sp.]
EQHSSQLRYTKNAAPGMNFLMSSRRKIAIVIIRKDGQTYVITFAKFLAKLESNAAKDISSQFD